MADAAAAAESLGVPEASRAAFAELYAALSDARGGQAPPLVQLQHWDGPELLGRSRAEVTVRSHLEAHGHRLRALAAQWASATGVAGDAAGEARAWRLLEQRFLFAGVYGAQVPLEDLLRSLEGEAESGIAAAAATASDRSSCFRVVPGCFGTRHAALRAAAYPYVPACGTGPGHAVLECHGGDSDEKQGAPSASLVGYAAMAGAYADDISVDPAYHGRGIGKALVCGVAARLAELGEKEMSLDVRACNLPAVEMYRALGFEIVRKHYPSFYDWHGGYRMRADTRDLVERMPGQGFDCSGLHARVP